MMTTSATTHRSLLVLATVLNVNQKAFLGLPSALIGGSDGFFVMQVSSTGWSEGECSGRAGWFPSSYVEKRQRIPASKVADAGLTV